LPKKRGAKLIPVSEDVIDEIVALADRIGKPVRKIVEELLSEGTKVYTRGGMPISQAINEYLLLLEMKRLGFTLIPVSILNKIDNDNDELRNEWFKAGKLIASMMRAQGIRSAKDIISYLKPVVMDAGEILLSNNESEYTLTIVALARNRNGVSALMTLISGVIVGLGYDIREVKIDEGLGILKFTEKA